MSKPNDWSIGIADSEARSEIRRLLTAAGYATNDAIDASRTVYVFDPVKIVWGGGDRTELKLVPIRSVAEAIRFVSDRSCGVSNA